MSDWKIKDSFKSGDDLWVKFGPSGDDGDSYIALFSSVVLAITMMNLFGLSGWGWGIFMWLLMLYPSLLFLYPAMLVSILLIFFA